MKENCAMCDGKLKKKKVEYEVYGKSLGKFPALVCDSCNEEWFDEKTSKKIEDEEKKLGFFGLSRETKIGYSGNSLIIRIPSELVKFMNLKKEAVVRIYPENQDKLCVAVR